VRVFPGEHFKDKASLIPSNGSQQTFFAPPHRPPEVYPQLSVNPCRSFLLQPHRLAKRLDRLPCPDSTFEQGMPYLPSQCGHHSSCSILRQISDHPVPSLTSPQTQKHSGIPSFCLQAQPCGEHRVVHEGTRLRNQKFEGLLAL
jgi:hypothetical protein